MKTVAALSLTLLASSNAWSTSGSNTNPAQKLMKDVSKTCTTAATCAALALGVVTGLGAEASNAVEPMTPAISINVNGPVLLDTLRDEMIQKRIVFLAESLENIFGPSFDFTLPPLEKEVLKTLALQALRGGGSVMINGQEVDVQVVRSEQGALTVQLSQKYLPKIPFLGLEERIQADPVPFVAPPPQYSASTVEVPPESTATPTVGVAMVAATASTPESVPFLDTPIFDGKFRVDVTLSDYNIDFHRAITPLDVVGITSAGLGGVYASSFAFYNFENWKSEQDAKAKKAAMEKKKAAAAAAKAKEISKERPEDNMTEKSGVESKEVEKAAV